MPVFTLFFFPWRPAVFAVFHTPAFAWACVRVTRTCLRGHAACIEHVPLPVPVRCAVAPGGALSAACDRAENHVD